MMARKIIIGSRGSDLALWQAHFVQGSLVQLGVDSEIKIIKTQGDKIQHLSFDKMEGKGFFTKEIEQALINNDIDLAVHSHKDLETGAVEGLDIAAVSYREDPADLLLINKESVDHTQRLKLKMGAVVGTSSARRKAQLKFFNDGLFINDLRGNVPTRVNKLLKGDYDAIMLAAAGVARLNLDLSAVHVERLDPKEFIPAPAQGVLALQVRTGDSELKTVLQEMNHSDVQEQIQVEREVLRLFDGGCQLPLGAYCIKEEGKWKLWATMSPTWDDPMNRAYMETDSPQNMAAEMVDQLKKKARVKSL